MVSKSYAFGVRKLRDGKLIVGRFAWEEDFTYLCSRDDKCAYK